MENWLKQTKDKPLFPEVIWSRPETKNGSGKLLIIGGSAGNFINTAKAYESAESAGAGTIHLLVPESLRAITKQIPFIDYAPANSSGGFSKQALAEILESVNAVDGVLIAGDLGKNSETSLMLDDFLAKTTKLLVITPQSLESFNNILELTKKPNAIICLDQPSLRQLFIETKNPVAITSAVQKPNLVKALKDFSHDKPAYFLVEILGSVWVVHQGKVAESQSTRINPAKSAVWAIGQPEKLYQSLVCSLI